MIATERARIPVASDVASDADLVRRLLRDAYSQAQASIEPDHCVADFERHRLQRITAALTHNNPTPAVAV